VAAEPLSQTKATRATKAARATIRPVDFALEVLGVQLWSRQEEVLDAIETYDRVAVRSGHGVGKTFTAAIAACWFLAEHNPALVITTAPTFRQVREVLWSEIRRLWWRTPWGRHKIGVVNQTEIRLSDNRRAFGFSTDDPQKLQGLHCENLLFVVDEAGGVERDIFEAAYGMLTGDNAKALWIGNPILPQGAFYDAFRSPEWHGMAISCLECPNVTQRREVIPGLTTLAWVEGQKREWGADSPTYHARVLGEFPEGGEDVLIPLSWAEAALKRPVGDEMQGAIVMGVDVARFGSDRTAFCIRDKVAIRHIEKHVKLSTMETAGRVKALAARWRIKPENIHIDDTGVGGGVTDRLRELGLKVDGVKFGAAAVESEKFADVRAEMYWAMREAVRPDSEHPIGIALATDSQNVVQEISTSRYGYTSRGQIRIESKDDIRKRLGRSPDLADAAALTFRARRPEPMVWV